MGQSEGRSFPCYWGDTAPHFALCWWQTRGSRFWLIQKIISASGRLCLLLFCVSPQTFPQTTQPPVKWQPPPDYPVSFPGSQQTKHGLTGKPGCNFPTGNLKEKTELKMFKFNKDFGKFRHGRNWRRQSKTKDTSLKKRRCPIEDSKQRGQG